MWIAWPRSTDAGLRQAYAELEASPVSVLVIGAVLPREAHAELTPSGYTFTAEIRGIGLVTIVGTQTASGPRYDLAVPDGSSPHTREALQQRLVPLDQASRDAFGSRWDTPLLYLGYLPLLVGFLVLGCVSLLAPSRRATLGLLVLALGTACAPPSRSAPPPPLIDTPAAEWSYGVRLLGLGDIGGGRRALERAAEFGAPELPAGNVVNSQAQFFRDLAEVRLATGDVIGAATATEQARARLADEPLTAQFKAEDRRRFQATLDALQAAADDDADRLVMLAEPDASPLADTSYLLGWVLERRGELPAARGAYLAYLARAPAWSFLRLAPLMQQHARAAAAR